MARRPCEAAMAQTGSGARPRGFPIRDLKTRERGGLGWELLRDVFTRGGLGLGCPCPLPRGESKSQACGPRRQPASAFPSVTWEHRSHTPGVTVKDKQLKHTEVPGTGVTVQRPLKLSPSRRACPRAPSREASLPAQAVLPTPLGLRQRAHRPAPHPALDPAQCPHASRHPGLCWGHRARLSGQHASDQWAPPRYPLQGRMRTQAPTAGLGEGEARQPPDRPPGEQRWAQ